jgi:hypothetical protein
MVLYGDLKNRKFPKIEYFFCTPGVNLTGRKRFASKSIFLTAA